MWLAIYCRNHDTKKNNKRSVNAELKRPRISAYQTLSNSLQVQTLFHPYCLTNPSLSMEQPNSLGVPPLGDTNQIFAI